MKNKCIIAVALFAALLCLAGTSFGEPPSFPMVCRGGPGMRIMIAHDVDSDGNPTATSMWIYFKAAARPGSAGQPGPGECTWKEHTLKSGEPSSLFMHATHLEFAVQVESDGRISHDASGIRMNPEGNSDDAQKARYLTEGVLKGEVFYVKAYNAGGRVLVVTGFGDQVGQ